MRDFISSIFAKKVKIQLQQKKSKDIYKITSVNNAALSYNQRVINYKIEDT